MCEKVFPLTCTTSDMSYPGVVPEHFKGADITKRQIMHWSKTLLVENSLSATFNQANCYNIEEYSGRQCSQYLFPTGKDRQNTFRYPV